MSVDTAMTGCRITRSARVHCRRETIMDMASSQTSGTSERDHFIPARKIDVLNAVIAHGALGRRAGAGTIPPVLPPARGDLSLRVFRSARTAAQRLLLFQSRARRSCALRQRPTVERCLRRSDRRADQRCFTAPTSSRSRTRRSSAPIASTASSASTSRHRWTTTARSDSSAAAITAKRSKFANGSAGASAASSSASMTTSSCW